MIKDVNSKQNTDETSNDFGTIAERRKKIKSLNTKQTTNQTSNLIQHIR